MNPKRFKLLPIRFFNDPEGGTGGAAPADPPTPTPAAPVAATPAEAGPIDGEESLGDPGKRALDSMKAKLNAEKVRRAAAESRAGDLEARLNARIIRSEVKAAAKGKLADPSDAFKFLDLAQFEVTDDGDIDEGAIASALDNLIKQKPYLSAPGAISEGDMGHGSRPDPTTPRQLSQSDLDSMTPEQIVEAQNAGQLNDLLSPSR